MAAATADEKWHQQLTTAQTIMDDTGMQQTRWCCSATAETVGRRNEADLLVLLSSLEHGSQGGDQVCHSCQLGQGQAARGLQNGLQLCLPHREAQLLPTVLLHPLHQACESACT